MISTADLITS